MVFPELTVHQWVLAALAAITVGLSKGGFAGIGIISVLLMAEVLPARASTGAILPLLIVADVLAVTLFRQHARWPTIWRVLPPAVVGIVAGYCLMQVIPDRLFRVVIGWIVMVMVVLQLARRSGRWLDQLPHTRGFAWLMGIWTGINTMVANAAGPVATIYLLALNMQKLEFVGTIAWMFLIINLSKVPFSAHLGLINLESLTLNAVLIPAVAAGVFLGRLAIGSIPQRLWEAALLLFAAIASLRLILA